MPLVADDVFSCPPDLTVATASAVKAALMDRQQVAIVIDVSDVRRIDNAGLQVLVAATASWRRRGLTWTWRGQSRAIDEAATLSGLNAALGLTLVAAIEQ